MKKLFFIFAVLLVLGIPSLAQEPHRSDGIWIGLALGSARLNKAFDGETYYVSTGENMIFPIPKFKDGRGFGVACGGKYDYFGMDLSYFGSSHDGEWAGIPWSGRQHIVSMDLKFFPIRRFPILPYLFVGGAFCWLTIEDGVIQPELMKPATYTDFGWRYGAGISFHPVGRLFLRGEIVNTGISYTAVTPKGGDWLTIGGELTGSVRTVMVILGWTIGRN